MNARTTCLIGILLVSQISGQTFGKANSLLSPDGAYALLGSDPALCQLWIEDRHTHQRRMVLSATLQTLTLGWSPDSTAFFANDRATSDVEVAWLFEALTLDRLDLRSLIVAADPDSARFIVPGQLSYVHAIRWVDARDVEVQLVGHTAGVRIGNSVEPGDCFDLRYRIGRDGAVNKLSQRVEPIDSKGCTEDE